MKKFLGLLALTGLLLTGATQSANAYTLDTHKLTYMSADEAGDGFVVPGAQLVDGGVIVEGEQEGYAFRLLNSTTQRTIVLITSRDGLRHIGIAMGVTAYRAAWGDVTSISGDPEFVFELDDKGNRVLKYWFFAGERVGIEFVD